MKFVIVPILMLAMLAQTFTQEFYYLSYLVDRADFEQNCINKAKAWLHCNGKCQLMKKIVESEKKQQNAPEMKLAGKSTVFFVNRTSYNDLFIAEQRSVPLFYNSLTYSPGFSKKIFHPPAV